MATSDTSSTNALSWVTAWVTMILLLALVAKTEWGNKIVYYVVWLAVVLLVVTHYKELTDLLKPIQNLNNSSTS